MQKFWTIKIKPMARAVLHKCVQCVKAKPVLYKQLMGNLPAGRVQPSRPFSNTGVNFCGPFHVHYKVRGKVYIAVFCCFATKASHLAVVTDLTTDAFIGSLKRFISHRGSPQKIYCDNATNFVGASNLLQDLGPIVQNSAAQEKLQLQVRTKA